jgi:hypothetical protein
MQYMPFYNAKEHRLKTTCDFI